MNAEQLAAGVGCRLTTAQFWLPHLVAAMDANEINTPQRQSMFLAQCAHESARFSVLVENLNYSASSLMAVFPSHFEPGEAAQYARQPERIANRVYANRNGNGDEASGDGWKYRGRGLIDITGRTNYRNCSAAIGVPLEDQPDLLEQAEYAASSAAAWWNAHALNTLADDGKFIAVTRVVNGGVNGLQERLALLHTLQEQLGIAS